MNKEAEELLEVGKLVGTHGLRGDLKVKLNSGDPDIFNGVRQVFLCLHDGRLERKEISRSVTHKGQLLLRFSGYDSINQVESFVGAQLLLAEDQLPDLHEDEYYWGQLQGLQVIDSRFGSLGTLEDVFSTSAHDTYVVAGRCGEILIPAVHQFIKEIDLEGGEMHVDLPEGLLPEEQ